MAYGNGKAIRASQEGLFCLSVAFMVTIVFLGWLIYRLFEGKRSERFLLFFTLFCSAPFLYEYERANIILLAFSCLCFFFAFMDSENKLLHELALLMLCIATAIKLYPVIYGLVLLKKRKWQDIIHCLVFGLIIMFVPFAFMGGIDGFFSWIASLKSGATNTLSVAQGVGYKVNFSNMIVTYYALTHEGAITPEVINLGGVVAAVLSALSLIAAVFQREKWKQMTLITCIVIGLPGFSFQYCMIFISLPLIFFLKQHSRRMQDYLYAILFSMMLMFAVFPHWKLNSVNGYYPLTMTVMLEEVGLMTMTIALILDTVISLSIQTIPKTRFLFSTVEEEKKEISGNNPLVSICIPVYNGEKTIRSTLEAALRQTYRPIEIIVVDNCSEDDTLKILHDMSQDRIIVYENTENIGMVGNWNRCLSYSKGEYAMILCADDMIEDDCIEKKVRMLESGEDIVFAFGASEVINENDKVLLKRRLFRENYLVDGAKLAQRAYLTKNLFGEPTNVLFRKSSMMKVGAFDSRMCYAVDLDMWLRLACIGRVAYAGDLLMKYRISTGNQTSSIRYSTFLKDDSILMQNLKKNNQLQINFFDDIIHRTVYALRAFFRYLFMRLVAGKR